MFAHTNLRTLFGAVVFGLCVAAGSTVANAQIAPKSPPKLEPPTAPRVARVHAPRIRGGSPADSFNFLELGDKFYAKGRWNAAMAAYKESIRLWSGSEAQAALKEIYEQTRVK